MITIKFPAKKTKKEIEKFFRKNSLDFFIKSSKGKNKTINQLIVKPPLIPQLADLYRLYEFIKLNRRHYANLSVYKL